MAAADAPYPEMELCPRISCHSSANLLRSPKGIGKGGKPMDHGAGLGLISLLPLIVISIPFAIGFFHVAGRVGKNPVAWAILSLIPLVNSLFWIYASFVVVLNILDRLPPLAGGAGQRSGSS
jgi:hypothetical protein